MFHFFVAIELYMGVNCAIKNKVIILIKKSQIFLHFNTSFNNQT